MKCTDCNKKLLIKKGSGCFTRRRCKKCSLKRQAKQHKQWKKNNYAKCLISDLQRHKNNYLKNPKKYINLTRQWYKKNSQKTKARVRKWKKDNPEKCKIYREIDAQRRKENPARSNKLSRLRRSRLPYNSPARITNRLRSRISSAIRAQNCNKFHKSKILLGCSISFFKKYITKQFKKGMTWKNYGYYGWHIDHIRPCVSFNLFKVEEQLKCFNYRNMQPLWAVKNMQKGGKWTYQNQGQAN